MEDRPVGPPACKPGKARNQLETVAPSKADRGERSNELERGMGAVAFPFTITTERLLWVLLLVFASLTRLWDLGYRTQHHDEGVHTILSWRFASGNSPYIHDPLSHGPFLFHANALVYQLLGASDTTSRLLPALTGIGIVATPLLLRDRDFLGRWGALAAGTFLLVSPSFLYYTRFIRHDPYTALGSLLLVAAIFRYLQSPHRKWILLAFSMVAFLLVNHEIALAILLAVLLALWSTLVLSSLRMLIPVHLAALALLVILVGMSSILDWEPLPKIPWQTGGPQAAREYYGELFAHPLVIGLMLVGALFLGACVVAVRAAGHRRSGSGRVMEPVFGIAPRGSVARGVFDAWNDPMSIGIGILVALGIFSSLFTTMFTNLNGLATATYATDGTLLYWLGQQDVRRGKQPWFYFITEGIQYEWTAMLLGTVGLLLLTGTLIRRLLHRDFSVELRLLFRVLIGFWLIFMLAMLSLAGEKMPWLIMHIVLPASLLSGVVIEDLVASARRWYGERQSSASLAVPSLLTVSLVGCAVAFFLIAADLTQGGYGADGMDRSVPQERLDSWWHVLVPLGIAVGAIAVVWLFRGVKTTAYGAAGGVIALMLLFQVHAGFRLAFMDGDVAIDTMIYNTVGPDAKMAAEDITATSELYLGDHSITVSNDGCTNWPMEWYFRDLPNHRLMNTVSPTPSELPAVIVGTPEAWQSDPCSDIPMEIPGYTSRTCTFRWHEPQADIYRNFAIAPEIPIGYSAWTSEDQDTGLNAILQSIWSSIASTGDPDQQQKLWRLLMYREQPGTLVTYRFKVYVQNDMLPYYNEAHYGQ